MAASDIIVGAGEGVATGIGGTIVGAVAKPVIENVQTANQLVNFLQNPSLAGAVALAASGTFPYKNELDDFASYNALFTLGCLTDIEANYPLSYRTIGPLVQLIKSGGTGGNKVPTLYETDGVVEYFIDNVEVHEMIAPRPDTRQTNATQITFNVIEPYSMGQFFQNLRSAALVTGHLNYMQAPFVLGIEFKGYDDEGNPKAPFLQKRYFPMRLIEANLSVNGSGSIYEVRAVPWNEQALFDEVQTIKNDVELRGSTVAQVLQSGAVSLAAAINETEVRNQQSLQVIQGNQYVISFPESNILDGISGLASAASSLVNSATTAVGNLYQSAYQSITGDTTGDSPATQQVLREIQGVSAPQSAIGESLRQQANTVVNEIGRSPIVRSWLDSGNTPMTGAAFAETAPGSGIFTRRNLTISDNGRVFTFRNGTRIQEIIEEIILISDYGRRISTRQEDAQGRIPWFKIETHVYNVGNPLATATQGDAPKVYVYRVVPYLVDASRFDRPGVQPVKNLLTQASAVKGYNYIYTGQNKDIIDFDVKFNYAFYNQVQNTRGQMQSDSKQGGQSQAVAGNDDSSTRTTPSVPGPVPAEGTNRTQSSGSTSTGHRGGGAREHVETQVARMFNDSLLNTADMIQVELKIHGDPFWMSDAGLGNYVAIPNPLNPAITATGAMNPNASEVLIAINFRTPVDYDGDDGFVKYPLGGFLPVSMFSGIFRVTECTNNFDEGKFTQTLKCLRLVGQEFSLENAAGAITSLFTDTKALVQGTVANFVDSTNANTRPR